MWMTSGPRSYSGCSAAARTHAEHVHASMVQFALWSQCLSILAGRAVTASGRASTNLMEVAMQAVADPAASRVRDETDRPTLGRVPAPAHGVVYAG